MEKLSQYIDEQNENVKERPQIPESKREVEPTTTDKEKFMNEKLVGTSLTRSDFMDDETTPSEKMEHLQAFAKSTYSEVEEAKKKKEAYERERRMKAEKEKQEKSKIEEYKDIVVDKPTTTTLSGPKQKDSTVVKMPNIKNIKTVKSSSIYEAFGDQMRKRRESAFSTKVPLPVSGYTASMLGLSSPEIRDYSETLAGLDRFGQMELRYRTVFEKIKQTSAGEMDFETFLKSTALLEFEILMYGLFSSSFPEQNTYPYFCSHCKGKMEFTYENWQYLDTSEEDPEKRKVVLSSIRKVLEGQSDGKEMFINSDVTSTIRKYLNHSKIIVELRHPTLHDQLYDVLGNINDENVKNPTLVNIMPFIKKVYLPTIETIESDEPEYIVLEDLDQKVTALTTIDETDDDELAIAIQDEILSKYNIKFTLRTPKCKSCGADSEAIPVSFEDMLFTTRQTRLRSKNR